MYKRRARVVFVDSTGRAAAPIAAALARKRGAEWLEARAAAITPSNPPPSLASCLGVLDAAGLGIEPLTASLKHWADLIVYFEPQLADTLEPRPATARLKHWPVQADIGTPDTTLVEELAARVDGMIGGMRMLARLSSNDDD